MAHRELSPTEALNRVNDRETGLLVRSVISGGTQRSRNAALWELLRHSIDGSIPVFILHAGNTALQRVLMHGGSGNVYLPRSGQNSELLFFSGLNEDDIALILNGAAQWYFGRNAQMLGAVKCGCQLLEAVGETPSLWRLAHFPWESSNDFLERHKGSVNVTDAMKTIAAESAGFKDASVFFKNLKSLLPPEPHSGIGLQGVLDNGGIVCLDVGSESNLLMAEVMLSLLNRIKQAGYPFLLVVDTLPFRKDSLLKELTGSRDSRNPTIYLSPNVFGTGLSAEELKPILKYPANLILFHHPQNDAADWSKFFEDVTYFREDVTVGETRERFGLKGSTNRSTTRTEATHRFLDSRELTGLPNGVALVFPHKETNPTPIRFTDT